MCRRIVWTSWYCPRSNALRSATIPPAGPNWSSSCAAPRSRRSDLRLPAPKLEHDPCAAGNRQAIEPRCAQLIEAHVRRTQPVAELLRAEASSELALNLINKERERHEIESLLPWHAAGTLDRSRRRACRAGACRGR